MYKYYRQVVCSLSFSTSTSTTSVFLLSYDISFPFLKVFKQKFCYPKNDWINHSFKLAKTDPLKLSCSLFRNSYLAVACINHHHWVPYFKPTFLIFEWLLPTILSNSIKMKIKWLHSAIYINEIKIMFFSYFNHILPKRVYKSCSHCNDLISKSSILSVVWRMYIIYSSPPFPISTNMSIH